MKRPSFDRIERRTWWWWWWQSYWPPDLCLVVRESLGEVEERGRGILSFHVKRNRINKPNQTKQKMKPLPRNKHQPNENKKWIKKAEKKRERERERERDKKKKLKRNEIKRWPPSRVDATSASTNVRKRFPSGDVMVTSSPPAATWLIGAHYWPAAAAHPLSWTESFSRFRADGFRRNQVRVEGDVPAHENPLKRFRIHHHFPPELVLFSTGPCFPPFTFQIDWLILGWSWRTG